MNFPHGLDYKTNYCRTLPITISQKIMKDNVGIYKQQRKLSIPQAI
jgi:hypothetical protein